MSIPSNARIVYEGFVSEAAAYLQNGGRLQQGLTNADADHVRDIALNYYTPPQAQQIRDAIVSRAARESMSSTALNAYKSFVRGSIAEARWPQPSTPSQPQGILGSFFQGIQAVTNIASNFLSPQATSQSPSSTTSQSPSSTTAQSSTTSIMPERRRRRARDENTGQPQRSVSSRTAAATSATDALSRNTPVEILSMQRTLAYFDALPIDIDCFNNPNRYERRTAFCELVCPADHTERTSATSSGIVHYLLRGANFDTNNINTVLMTQPFLRMVFCSDDDVARAEINDFMDRTFPVALRELRSLDCSNCSTLTDAQLEAISRACPNLQNINVSNCPNISNVGARAIATHCRQLQHVNVSGTGITNDGVRDLASCPLQSLDIGRCGIADDVLRDLATSRPQLQSLNLQGCINIGNTGLAHLANLAQLRDLNLSECRQITDFTPLAACTQLRDLNLEWTRVADLTPLAGCTQLRDLNLQRTAVTDLTPLAGCTQLRDLNLRGTGVADLTPLAGCIQLRDLNLGLTRVTNLTPLVGCTQLRDLDFLGTPVADLTPLAGRTQLRDLNLMVCRQVTDLTPLAGCTQLRDLNLCRTAVVDLTPLAGCTQLRNLNLAETPVEDLTPLDRCTRLHVISNMGF